VKKLNHKLRACGVEGSRRETRSRVGDLGGAGSACGFLLALPGLLPLRLQFVPLALQRNQAIKNETGE